MNRLLSVLGTQTSAPGGGGATVVASYYDPAATDLGSVPELNGVFYTVPAGQAGLYALSASFTTPGAHAIGIDQAVINVWLNGEPGLDAPRTIGFSLGAGGEGTQVTQETTPTSLLLKDGDTIHLSSYGGGTVSVAVRLELLALAGSL